MIIKCGEDVEALFERLTCEQTMIEAQQEIAAMGDDAIALLKGLFDGSSRNEWGISYRDLGLPLHCGLEIVVRLGSKAISLEPYINAELPKLEVAARALGALGQLSQYSVSRLASALESHINVASEAAMALVRCGYDESPAVMRIADHSEQAKMCLLMARKVVSLRKDS